MTSTALRAPAREGAHDRLAAYQRVTKEKGSMRRTLSLGALAAMIFMAACQQPANNSSGCGDCLKDSDCKAGDICVQVGTSSGCLPACENGSCEGGETCTVKLDNEGAPREVCVGPQDPCAAFTCSSCPAGTTCNQAAQRCDPNASDGLSCTAPAAYNTSTSSGRCGVYRWSVKTGTDPDAVNVDLSHVQVTTIANLVAIPAPSYRPSNGRISPLEDTVYEIKDVQLTQDALEADSDFHMVVSDGSNTMITEVPFPGCVGTGSPFACYITHARAAAENQLHPTTSFTTASVTATIVGVGFSDDPHARGAAPSGVELHPVLAICFGQGCNPFSD